MPRDQTSGRVSDGQERILGVHVREHPALVPIGYGTAAVNQRFREGVPETRLGTVHPGWLNNTTSAGTGKYTTIYGQGRFLDSDRRVWNLKAADGAVYASLANNFPIALTLPAGVTITQEVTFEQLDDTVIMMRGDAADPLQMDNLLAGFTAVPAAGPGYSSIPRGRQALAVGGRLWVVTGTDQLWASRPLNHTEYPEAQKFVVSDGVPDALVAIALFNETSIIALKDKSVWRVVNVIGTTLAAAEPRRITRRYGCVAAKSVVDIGTDLMWWSQDGPASLTITEFNELQTGQGKRPMPGLNIDGLLKRVNAMYRSGICAGFWDNKVYFAAPLDDAQSALRHEVFSGNYRASTPDMDWPVIAGATYAYTPGANETNLQNGAQAVTVAQNITAAAATVGLSGSANVAVTGSLRQVFAGCNNAVLVLDTLLPSESDPYGSWQGYDQGAGIEPKQFFMSEYLGQDRLCFIGADGWTCLYEEGYEDAAPEPWVDVTVTAVPAALNTVRIGGGSIVEAFADNTNNVGAPLRWGIGVAPALATAQANLWVSVLGGVEQGGYAPNTAGGWTHPQSDSLKLPTGVRFTSLDGRMPSVATTGSWATLAYTRWQQIAGSYTSRGLPGSDRLRDKRSMMLVLVLETWNPSYSVTLLQDGVNESDTPVSGATRSRTVYDGPWHMAPWDPTNVNNDFATPQRQDYSLDLGSGPGFKLGTGLGLGLHQERRHDLLVNGRGRAPRVRIDSTQGRVRVLALGTETQMETPRMREDS